MNDIIKKLGITSSIISGIGFILVGLVILGISLFALVNHQEYDGKTTATISYIKQERKEFISNDDSNEEQYEYTVFVDYVVDGKEYKHVQFDSYDSSMKVGQTINIKYDLNDPSKIQSQNGMLFIIAFIIIGFAAIVFGIFNTIKSFKQTKENPMYQVMRN